MGLPAPDPAAAPLRLHKRHAEILLPFWAMNNFLNFCRHITQPGIFFLSYATQRSNHRRDVMAKKVSKAKTSTASKKPAAKVAAKKPAATKKVATAKPEKVAKERKARELTPLHQKLAKLFERGATVQELTAAGWKFSALAGLSIFERRGYKTSVSKKPGELTVYTAKAGSARS
jgi:hypothetical protein